MVLLRKNLVVQASAVLILVLILVSIGAVGAPGPEIDTAIGQIVIFNEGVSSDRIGSLLSRYEHEQIGPDEINTFLILTDDPARFVEEAGDMLRHMEQDRAVELSSTYPYDDSYIASQWALDNMDLWEAWDISRGSDSVRIAVIDSGLERNVEDFESARILYGWDFIESDIVTGDPNGHGTMVTGIIAATPGNAKGIAGTNEFCTIIPLRILDEKGEGDSSDLISAIYMAVEEGADIINMSLGSEDSVLAESIAVQYAVSKGCIVIAAAGNTGETRKLYPASYPGVISVASHTIDDQHSDFSTYNSSVDISAPGSGITVLLPDGGYATGSGTSFAAPYVSGTAALAKAIYPEMTPDDFLQALSGSGRDIGPAGKDVYSGYGAVDADDLLRYIIENHDIETTEYFRGTEYYGPAGDYYNAWMRTSYPVSYFYTEVGGSVSFDVSEGASYEIFSDKECAYLIRADEMTGAPGLRWVYLKVTAENGIDTKVYTVLIYVVDPAGGSVPEIVITDIDGILLPEGIHTQKDVVVLPFGVGAINVKMTLNGSAQSTDARYGVNAEGDYLIEVTDGDGVKATAGFIIDRTAPVVSGAEDGSTYYRAVSPVFGEGMGRLDGYEFDSGDVVSAEGEHVLEVSDRAGNTVTVRFGISKRTVTFVSNGGSQVDGMRVFDGEKIAEPDAPFREGYVLAGWYTSSGGTTEWDFDSDIISADLALYAVWKTRVPSVLTSAVFMVQESAGTISGIRSGTSAAVLLEGFGSPEYVRVIRQERVMEDQERVATGDRIRLVDGTSVIRSYNAVVTGDTSGDGRISLTDFIQMKAHLLGKKTLDVLPLIAGDVNGDSKISLTDYIRIKAYLIGKDSGLGE